MNALSLPSIPDATCVYFAMDRAQRVKIGYSADPFRRVRSIETISAQPLEVIRLVEGGKRIEKWMHRRFAEHKISGEWFSFCDEMLTVVPPEFVQGIPKEVIRRDVRLTLRERLTEGRKMASDLGLNDHQALLLFVQQMNDEEAKEALRQLCEAAGIPE